MFRVLLISNLLILLFVLVDAVYAKEAEATVEETFVIKADFKTVVEWAKKNSEEVSKRVGVKIEEKRSDGTLKVSRTTRKGTFVWVMEETQTETENQFDYRNKLVESLEGGVIASTTHIVIKPGDLNTTTISVELYAKVDHPRIRSGEMKLDFNLSINRVKRYMALELED